MPGMPRSSDPQENGAENFDKASDRQSPDQSERRSDKGCSGKGCSFASAQSAKQAEIDQELTDKAVERRQAADGDRANQKTEGRGDRSRECGPRE